MKYRVLFLCLVSLSALRCGGDNPAWSNDLGITVESAQVETQTFGDALDDNNRINRLQCVITLSKEGRSFTREETVRVVVEFFDGDTSLGAGSDDISGLPGNGARTEVRKTFEGWFDTPQPRESTTSITNLVVGTEFFLSEQPSRMSCLIDAKSRPLLKCSEKGAAPCFCAFYSWQCWL